MYLEMLYNLYGRSLEKRADAHARKWWIARHGGSPYLVRKVTSPETGVVKRYQGSLKGPDYYKNMAPSNPGHYHDYKTVSENSPYYNAVNNVLNATIAGNQPSEEDARLTDEYLTRVSKLKRRSRSKIERAPYVH